jgi:hypothetical protein
VSGAYFERDHAKEPAGLAMDEAAAERLWEESARLVGVDA